MTIGDLVIDKFDPRMGMIVRAYTDDDGFRVFVVHWTDGRVTHWDFATCRTCMKVLQ